VIRACRRVTHFIDHSKCVAHIRLAFAKRFQTPCERFFVVRFLTQLGLYTQLGRYTLCMFVVRILTQLGVYTQLGMYTHMCVYLCQYVYVYRNVCFFVVRILTHLGVCTHTCVYIHINMYMCIEMCTYIVHVYRNVYIRHTYHLYMPDICIFREYNRLRTRSLYS